MVNLNPDLASETFILLAFSFLSFSLVFNFGMSFGLLKLSVWSYDNEVCSQTMEMFLSD